MVYSCLLPRELTLNIYNEANAEPLAAALWPPVPETSMKARAILRAQITPRPAVQPFTQILYGVAFVDYCDHRMLCVQLFGHKA